MIRANKIFVGYDKKLIIEDLSLEINKGDIVSIVGPNGCGKSTLLKSLTKLLLPYKGEVFYNGKDISKQSSKQFSKKVAILSQHHDVPPDTTVRELVFYGRLPHKKWYQISDKNDYEIVTFAMKSTKILHYADVPVSRLSGGEQQRAWISMAIAQNPEILLLDEPTTYLDISHQLELMKLIKHINKTMGITVIMVLHDLNQASKYSDRIILMKSGEIYADGSPSFVMTQKNLREVYNIECSINKDNITSDINIIPIDVCDEVI